MTQQIPDELHWQDQTWYVVEFCGTREAIPTSEALGFRTAMASTACYTGRVDCFALTPDGLKLAAMVVNLAPDMDPSFVPVGATRESTGRMGAGETTFRFVDCPIPFSGRMTIGADPDDGGRFARTATLLFDTGRLLASDLSETPLGDDRDARGFV